MKIHCFEKDVRFKTDPNFLENMGPFSVLHYEMNKQLKEKGFYSEKDEADYILLADGLDVGFRYRDKKSVIWNVWESSNSLPLYLLQIASGQKIVGLSNQITNLWKKYGLSAETLYPGCDTNFWHQSCEKDELFTFLHINSSSVRSGIDLSIKAFELAFEGNKNVKLVIKDTNDSHLLNKKIEELKRRGFIIEHIKDRLSFKEIRSLYSKSHVCLNLLRMTSFGLPLLECSACNCLCVTGDIQPTNEIINQENGVLIKSSGEVEFCQIIPKLQQEWGLRNAFPNLQYLEEPRMFDFDVNIYAKTLLSIYTNWDFYKKINSRKFVVENWNWELSANRLIKLMTENDPWFSGNVGSVLNLSSISYK